MPLSPSITFIYTISLSAYTTEFCTARLNSYPLCIYENVMRKQIATGLLLLKNVHSIIDPYATLYIGIGQIDDFVVFVKKHGPHIKHSVGEKMVQDE